MTSNGFSIGDIAAAINERLKRMLPPNIFFAACLLSVDAVEKRLSVWNGGIPDVLIAGGDNGVRARAKSRHVPLGVLPAADFKRTTETLPLRDGDLVYVCTDGIIDAPIASGGRFGAQGYEACFDPDILPARPFDLLLETMREIHGDGPLDDATLIEITVDDALARSGSDCTDNRIARVAAPWSMNFEFSRATLRQFDPVPFLLRGVVETQGLARHKETLYTVLSELFNNALDHGVLRLDSGLKSSPAGFAAYLAERARRLAEGGDGYVRVWFKHVPQGNGGRLRIRVEDSGPGFDHARARPGLAGNVALNGRGIPLLRSLCESLEFHGKGNEVEAVFAWG
jgi:anti-sigma regulatory factor (Ser/Thr protein kinase)